MTATRNITNGSLMRALILMGVPPYQAMHSVTYCGEHIRQDGPNERPYMTGKNNVRFYVDEQGGSDA